MVQISVSAPARHSTARGVQRASFTIFVPTFGRAAAHRVVKCFSLQDKDLRIGFIGAGGINFGTPEGPWNHAARLERLPGVSFSCIVDPNATLAQQRVSERQADEHGAKWADTRTFKSYQDMLARAEKPNAVFIGVPPLYHGSLEDPKADLEVQLAKAGIHLFVEKPLSIRPAAEVSQLAQRLGELQKEHDIIIAVGYMLRYSPAIEAAKELLKEYNAKPVSVMARYACAYTHILKRDWWDTKLCGGPIVEQATHFVDLMRYLGGEIVQESIKAVAVGPALPLSDMAKAPQAEHEVPMEQRINRATSAVFRFQDGAIGSLSHTALLHESRYHTALEIVCDGLHILVEDPYGDAQVTVRKPHSETYEKVKLDTGADMYAAQAEAFIAAIRSGDSSGIRSLYLDAVKSYEATQWITAASSADRA